MKRFLIWLLLAVAALVFVSTHVVWLADLPDRLATHFNASGKANGWMSRRSHGSFMLVFRAGRPRVYPHARLESCASYRLRS